jgi:hypothetical protein
LVEDNVRVGEAKMIVPPETQLAEETTKKDKFNSLFIHQFRRVCIVKLQDGGN